MTLNEGCTTLLATLIQSVHFQCEGLEGSFTLST